MKDDSKLFAFLGIFLTVIGFIIVIATRKNDKYAMFYAKQGLVLFIAYVIVAVAQMVLVFIPIVGWIIITVAWVGLLVLWIIGLINSLSGEMKDLPLIGEYARKLKF